MYNSDCLTVPSSSQPLQPLLTTSRLLSSSVCVMARQAFPSTRSPYPLSYGAFSSSPTDETLWWGVPTVSTHIVIHEINHGLHVFPDIPCLPRPSRSYKQDPRISEDLDVQVISLEGPLRRRRPSAALHSAWHIAPAASDEPPSISRCPSLMSSSSIASHPSNSSLNSHSTRKRRRTLRHKYSPPGQSLRELRCMESEASLKQVYETQLNAYLDGSIFGRFGRSETNR